MAEKEYIERDEAYKIINEAMTAGMVNIFSIQQRRANFEEVLEVIEEIPAADVQEVVRCKDCIYRHSSEFCECREPNFYCADGERIDGEENENV